MTVKYVVANGDTVTKELIPTARQYSNYFEGNNAAMIYLRPPHDPRAAILKDQGILNEATLVLYICTFVFLFIFCGGSSLIFLFGLWGA